MTDKALYWFDADRETLIKETLDKQEALGCGKIVVKTAFRKGTKTQSERIEITVELAPDYQKDYEIIAFHIVPVGLGAANINQHIAFLRIKYWFNASYISIFLKSYFIKVYIQIEQCGASKEAFNLNQIANIPLVLPPLQEQKAIANYLDAKTAQIDQIIQTINTQVEKLKELRKTLINDVVTGKIKV